MIRPQDWRGRRLAVATRHGKARALRVPLHRVLGVRLSTPRDLDTDALGTFTGEIPRTQAPREAAAAKARLALNATPRVFAVLASEASFGPDPVLGVVPLHHEWLVCVTAEAPEVVISVGLATHMTQFAYCNLLPGRDPPEDFLRSTGFPAHALILRAMTEPPQFWKALRSRAALAAALADASALHAPLRLETDMRAHLNPTRMAHLGRLGVHLGQRLTQPCPACGSSGFGFKELLPGLPCAICDAPTVQVGSERHTCPWCAHTVIHTHTGQADPTYCPICNP